MERKKGSAEHGPLVDNAMIRSNDVHDTLLSSSNLGDVFTRNRYI